MNKIDFFCIAFIISCFTKAVSLTGASVGSVGDISSDRDAVRVAVLGDSITEDGGYIRELRRLCPGLVFDNYGISCETSFQVAGRVTVSGRNHRKKILALEEYDYLVVLAGINNIHAPSRVIEDLKAIYARAKSVPNKNIQVVALTLTPWGGSQTWTPRKQANTLAVNHFILSHPENVDYVVNLYDVLKDPFRPDRMKYGYYHPVDPLHPRGGGQKAMGQAIFKAVFESLLHVGALTDRIR